MLPPLDAQTGFLPVGRHTASHAEVQAAFVTAPAFAGTNRAALWQGLANYLGAWDYARLKVSDALVARGEPPIAQADWLKTLWLGGSFISSRPQPSNIDLTLFVDGGSVARCRGIRGAGQVGRLSQRDAMLKEFEISPIVVQYRPVVSPFKISNLTPEQREYVAQRGAWDEWWLHARPANQPKGAPTLATIEWARGYVEVLL